MEKESGKNTRETISVKSALLSAISSEICGLQQMSHCLPVPSPRRFLCPMHEVKSGLEPCSSILTVVLTTSSVTDMPVSLLRWRAPDVLATPPAPVEVSGAASVCKRVGQVLGSLLKKWFYPPPQQTGNINPHFRCPVAVEGQMSGW